MDIDKLLSLGSQLSLFLMVLATGMAAQHGEATALLRQPALLVRSVVAMQVLAPVVAVLLATRFSVDPVVGIALVALATGPVPPFLPRKELGVNGERSYVVSVLATSALLSVITVPVTLSLLSDVFGLPLLLAPLALAKVLLVGVVVPLAVGLVLARVAPAFSATWAWPIGAASAVVLGLATLPQLVAMLPAFTTLAAGGALIVMATYAAFTLIIGHVLGGTEPEHRRALALSTATRHPGIAIALVSANFTDLPLAVPAVLLLVLVSALATAPYVAMTRRRHAQPDAGGAQLHPPPR